MGMSAGALSLLRVAIERIVGNLLLPGLQQIGGELARGNIARWKRVVAELLALSAWVIKWETPQL